MRLSALKIGYLLLAAVIVAVVAWLWLTADETMQALHARADRDTLGGSVTLSAARTLAPEETPPEALPAADPPPAVQPAGPAMSGGDSGMADTAPVPQPEAAADPAITAPSAETVPAVPPVAPALAALDLAVPEPTVLPPEPATALEPAVEPPAPAAEAPEPPPAEAAEPLVAMAGEPPPGAVAMTQPPEPPGGRPEIAIVVWDLGLHAAQTESALAELPNAVTLAFSPFSSELPRWLQEARQAGHETMLMVPMEPSTYPRDDPGPYTLLTTVSEEENASRLNWLLGRGSDYVGVVTEMGSRFTREREALQPVLEQIRDRSLILLDSRTTPDSIAVELAQEMNVEHAANNLFIDELPSAEAIDRRLAQLEQVAREQGRAVGMALYPIAFDRLKAWIPTLEAKGLALVPISRVSDR